MKQSKTILYVTRHGQTKWNSERRAQGHLNSPLTDLGKEQAARLAKRLEPIHFDAVYTSTLGRTMETAKIALAGRAVEIKQSEQLKELFFGDWEGMQFAEIEARDGEQFNNLWHRPDIYNPSSGEKISDFVERIKKEIETIAERHRGETVFIVAHGGVIKALMYAYQHGNLADFWKSEPYAEPTSLSKLVYSEGTMTYEMLPDASHLDGLPSEAI